jgi:hypothetical protein
VKWISRFSKSTDRRRNPSASPTRQPVKATVQTSALSRRVGNSQINVQDFSSGSIGFHLGSPLADGFFHGQDFLR